VPVSAEYDLKEGEGSSHAVIMKMLEHTPPSRILDLGCSGARLSEQIRGLGHTVVGVDSLEIDGVRDRVDEFVLGDLEDGVPAAAGKDFDVVIAADVIEHVRDPGLLLRQMAAVLKPGGELIISTPNFGHWYSRGRAATGTFDYDRRGILDQTHLRFFTRASLRRLFSANGLDALELDYTGLPFAVLSEGLNRRSKLAAKVDRGLVRARPTLFGYQFVARLRPRRGGSTRYS
jgi:SAM-dependent methyltransferase